MSILPTKFPLDRYPYEQHSESKPYDATLEPGEYVYVQEADGAVWVAPQGYHMHPRVLGRARPAAAAGEILISDTGEITMVNNISGTFQFGPKTLQGVVDVLRRQGATVADDAIRQFHWEK